MSAIRIIHRRFCLTAFATAMLLGLSPSAWAADEAGPAKRRVAPVRQEKPVTPAKTANANVGAETPSGDAQAVPSSGQIIFQILLAEIALQRGDANLASTAYADLALRTRDAKVLERTVDVAGFARRFDLALDAARRWVEVEPESKQAQYVLASVMVMSNQTDDLAPVLIRMLEADKAALSDNLLGLNRMLARNPDRRAVFAIIDRVCRPFTGLAEAHYAIAVAAAGAGELDRARAEARRAMELRSDWEAAALLQSQLLARLSPEESIVFLRDFVDRQPKARDVRMQLARLLVGAKRHAEARREFEEVLKIAPDSADALFSIGVLALQQNDLAEAEAQFNRFLALPVADKNYAYFFLGQIAEERRQFAGALAHYARVSGGEYYIQARMRGARLLVNQGNLEEARRQLSSAKASSAEERVQLGVAEAGLLRDAKQPRAAFELLESLLAKQPEQTDLLYESALLAEKLGQFELMEIRLRKLIELRPEGAQGYNALGYSLADRNLRLDEARVLIEKALALSPEDYFILDSMGWVLYRQGDLSAALGYLEKAHARKDDPEIAAHIGEVLWALNRRDEARTAWLEAQRKHPENEALAETIKKFLP